MWLTALLLRAVEPHALSYLDTIGKWILWGLARMVAEAVLVFPSSSCNTAEFGKVLLSAVEIVTV